MRGEYYSDVTLQTLVAARTDATVNFNWGNGSPFTGVPQDYFGVRWSGSVLPLTSEVYTFYVTSDDGCNLWVNGVLLISNWNPQSSTTKSGTISLTSGVKYHIVLEYFDATGLASVALYWSAPSFAQVIIPSSQLLPAPAGYLGCFADGSPRDLDNNVIVSSSVNTVEKCQYACGVRGYNYSALQYSLQCFCGNTYGRYGQVPDSSCTMACSGNANEICGASGKNSVYRSGKKAGYIGCYVDSASVHDLPIQATTTATLTVDVCRSSCVSLGKLYSGVQNGNQCWCGDSYGSLGKDSDSACNTVCPGNSAQFCGAANRNSIYTSYTSTYVY